MLHTIPALLAGVLSLTAMPPEQVGAWREDLAFLRTELPAHHLNAFHTITREEWERRVAELDAALPEIDEDAARVRLMGLVAAIGDGHTSVGPQFAQTVYPLALRCFSDGVVVTGALEGQKEALGARLTAVESEPVATVMEKIAAIISHDNDEQVRETAPRYLSSPGILHGLGIATTGGATYTLERDGRTWSVRCEPQAGVPRNAWIAVPAPQGATAPLYRTDVSKPYWWRAVDDGRVVYVAYNACREDPDRPFQDLTEEVLGAIAEEKVERVIIDLRNNSGGNSAIARPLIDGLGSGAWAGEKGRIIALIGRRTYSSGMMNAIQLKQRCGAVLMGEPTGGKPNSYGEMRSLKLPRSGYEVYYCTKYFRQVDGDPPSVEPDVRVETSSADWFGWRDPVLEAARQYKP